MCPCAGCCARRPHYPSMEAAGSAAHAKWVVSRVVSTPAQCPCCHQWVLR